LGKDIVMLHGANCGAWCFERFRPVFESRGWNCLTPDLIGHGARANGADQLIGVGMADYRAELSGLLDGFAAPPVLLGHSMGAVLAQMFASEARCSALILLSPAPRAGILPATDSEKLLAQALMAMGAFWTGLIDPVFDLACHYTLNRVPESERRQLFDRFGPESGRAFFELFFWMFDLAHSTAVDTAAIDCPVLCVGGRDDRLISSAVARATVAPIKGASHWELEEHAHMLPLEPGAEELAERIVGWLADQA
jgi:pimeloyl-ACP methyl ester carboxylesterase